MASDTFRSPHDPCPLSNAQLRRSLHDFAATLGWGVRWSSVVGLLVLLGRDVVELAVQAGVVVPMHVVGGQPFHVGQLPQRAVAKGGAGGPGSVFYKAHA